MLAETTFLEQSFTQMLVLLGTAVGALIFVVKTIISNVNKQQSITNKQINETIKTLQTTVKCFEQKLDEEQRTHTLLLSNLSAIQQETAIIKQDTSIIRERLDKVKLGG